MKKGIPVLVISLFIVSILSFSPAALTDVETESAINFDDSLLTASEYVPRDIRVAIYDETNTTTPAYATDGGVGKNNATGLRDILEGYGYDVTLLDVQDISNSELTTANYDVFCLPDNYPRENITYRVMDFWLGGGGLLIFDSSAVFLCSFGILPSEAIGTSGSGTYWTFNGNDVVIAERHPVTKSVSGTINTIGSNSLVWYFPWLLGTSIASDLTNAASSGVSSDWSMVLAYDPSDRGGKVVTIQIDLENDPSPEFYPIYSDAVDWVAPRPKARVLYDLTHQPWTPTDTWEWAGDANYLTTYRDGLVANSHTVDKLHPSALGNLTAENLAPYDMLVTNQPMLNFSDTEILAVEEWVLAGGGLFVVGDNPNVIDNHHLDDLIVPFGIQFNTTVTPYDQVVSTFDMHPTTEGCTSLTYHGSTSLVLSGGAYPIWSYAPGEVAAAASEYGEGRVVVICDANSVLDTWIVESNNEQFAMNVANWLTTSSATVLLYHDNAPTPIPSYNFYRTAVANALNELGIEFMLTFDRDYFNLSLNSQDWDLVISDANGGSGTPVANYRFILEHLENGGKLIMRDFWFKHPNGTLGYDLALFSYIGFEGTGASITSGAPTVYMWNEYHYVFNRPVDFAVDHFDSTANFYGTDWTNVTLLGNATAIAGVTPSPEVNQSAIILGVEGRALCNMFSISQYFDDFDDSTYADNFELWLNEIAYMMRPTIDSLGDLVIDLYDDPNEFTWNPHSYAPGDYQIKRNSTIISTQVWDGSSITVDVSGLSVGVYLFELMVRDHVGFRTNNAITVTIEDSTPTTTTTTTTTDTTTTGTTSSPTSTTEPPPGDGDITMILIIAGAVGVVIIIVIIIITKKK